MGRRWQITAILLVLTLVLTLVLACAPKPAPPPPAPPTPTPAPTPAPPPPKPKPEPYTIEMGSSKVGSVGYVLVHATCEIINKNSPWLRATFVETTGATENIRTVAEEPAKRKKWAYYVDAFTIHQASVGDPPFTKPYTTNKIIARMVENPTWLATSDPNIKTGKDLIGKRVAIGPKGISIYWHTRYIVEHGWGIWDQVKIEPLGFGDGKDALINGLIDAAIQGSTVMTPGETASKPKAVAPNPAGRELVDRAKPYVVDIDKGAIEKASKETGYPLFWVEIPAGTYGPNQTQPVGGDLYAFTWSCDIEMPDDVVYEICRLLYENAGKFADYHVAGKAITQKGLGMVAGATEADFHPGAVKFYKEHGIKIGG